MKSYLYFITDGNGHIKIGKSENPKVRLATLQTGSALLLDFYKMVEFENPRYAYGAEQELHSMFREYRISGEWFKAQPIIQFLEADICRTASYAWNNCDMGGLISDFPTREEELDDWLDIMLYDVLSTNPFENKREYEENLKRLSEIYVQCRQNHVEGRTVNHASWLLKANNLPERSCNGWMDQTTQENA